MNNDQMLNLPTKFNEELLIQNWQTIKQKVASALSTDGTMAESIKLIAVSKTKPIEMIDALARRGQQDFGENYLQEALEKITQLKKQTYKTPIVWHYIGHIQRNKTRDIAENFDWVHTLERDIIAKRLADQRPEGLPPLNILIQVNIDAEASKSGCHPDAVLKLVDQVLTYPNLTLRGLMIIPSETSTDAFERTQIIFNKVKEDYPQIENWDTLSMGMSNDMESAIKHGSNMVRIGTAIFGSRN